ncbi:TonB-dependent receptor [Leptolyngbya sp. 7M]|uniref:TonB-dependent receptor n=1 Tax=Leptolyngbya sp. 7M TaxID=2812896 RepID=UPI001B8C1283|nr:TonB-dependent receptor [Leptolyngbya sp. 7M]QYO67037.1 TonB-dependent receptor [Leptolyngbya sp. 7M]
MKFINRIILLSLISLSLSFPTFAQQTGSITGQVQDSLGAVIVGATITIVSPTGQQRTATSNQRGEFSATGLAPGNYTVKVFATNFALYENTEVQITAGQRTELFVLLTVEAVTEQVDVETDNSVSTDPENNLGATVLRGSDIDALPDDPDELEAALQALAGPSAGPNGGQIYIDGFTGGRLPPREAIREIRINQNPFSAEYDRLGFGRIEILTRPGSDRFRGNAFFNFNDARLNSRNPFVATRAPSQTRFFGGNISGPVQKGKSSFFMDINNRDQDNNTVLNARILDANLNTVPVTQDIKVPSKRFSIGPRFDYAIDQNNTLVARYNFSRFTSENQGVGGISLLSRAFTTETTNHEFRLTETMIINPKTVNETRFEYSWSDREQLGDNSIPTVSVAEAFSGGGSQIGQSFNKQRSIEIQNFTTTTLGKASNHSIKFGGRLRYNNITDRSENNFSGNFTFINLENYRQTILGNSYPSQFSITVGNPQQKVTRTDVGLFITDDWRVNPGLTLSFGLRYENQTNISDNFNFAPRLSFAWSPGAGGARAPKTVFRGGFGIFYDRFSENLTLQALRFNGLEQTNLIVNSLDPDPDRRAAAVALLQQAVFTLNGVTNVPTADQILAALPQSNTIRTISPDMRSPYTMQIALGMERQLPMRTNLSVFYIGARTNHVLRTRNVNAPVCASPVDCLNAIRPIPDAGNIYQYESSGISNQNQMIINFRTNFNPRVSLFGNYRLGFANSDADGAGSFPAYSYDLSDEYGRSSFDIRHNFFIGGNINLPWQISLNPFINMNSGRPFNIIRGFDSNADSLFTERPTFGELAARCAQLGLTNSFCDIGGKDPNAIIPRNYGNGPKFFSVNMRLSKNFGFGKTAEPAAGF